MYSAIKSLEFCYGHRLCDYPGKCRHWHGHNGRVEIECRGYTLGPDGMLADFSEIKRLMQPWIDENLDHRMILRVDDPAVDFIRAQGGAVLTLDENPTAEAIAKLIFMKAREVGLPVNSVRLWETSDSSAVYSGD